MTVQDKVGGKPKQLSEVQLREMARGYVPEAMDKLVDLMRNGDNDNVKLGAVKTILSKVIPDLKSSEINGEIKGKWIVELKKYGDNTGNQVVNNPPA